MNIDDATFYYLRRHVRSRYFDDPYDRAERMREWLPLHAIITRPRHFDDVHHYSPRRPRQDTSIITMLFCVLLLDTFLFQMEAIIFIFF